MIMKIQCTVQMCSDVHVCDWTIDSAASDARGLLSLQSESTAQPGPAAAAFNWDHVGGRHSSGPHLSISWTATFDICKLERMLSADPAWLELFAERDSETKRGRGLSQLHVWQAVRVSLACLSLCQLEECLCQKSTLHSSSESSLNWMSTGTGNDLASAWIANCDITLSTAGSESNNGFVIVESL